MTPVENARARPLRELLAGMIAEPLRDNPVITGLTLDSRAVQHGFLFLAVPGTRVDGRAYMAGALARGAAAVAYESNGYESDARVESAIGVPGLRRQVGVIADRFYDSPSKKLKVVGVTGTNGKTTTTHLLAQALDRHGQRCGLIGTLGCGFPDALDPGVHTTPDAIRVHELLSGFAETGAQTVCMEVSSHALDQSRVAGVAFNIAVFTNLTRDHLDYHGDMDRYAAAKARLFDFPHLEAIVINADDRFGRELLARSARPGVRVLSFGLEQGDVHAHSIQPSTSGLRFVARTPYGEVEVKSPLLGRFNAANLLGVLAVLLVNKMPLAEAAAALAQAQPVAGRMERFGGEHQPLVVVDYAHTPDALDKVLSALREHTRGRLVCVFGCGGDRDRGKRALMGAIAERLADIVILTNDNPRHESPQAILDEIAGGMRTTPTVVPDRTEAIRAALHEVGSGDVVLVAGKGHEDYQQIGDRRIPYSDRDTVRTLLREAA
jgi:UDP-N-acetylmuramoyl-L-alanyl-D-glutamate--2,6-diaminopimelate ligase